MPLKYGKKPARPGAVKLKFNSFFSLSQLPTPPILFGKPNLINTWGMMGNDTLSDCVFAGAAHETMLWSALVGNPVPVFTTNNVVADYSACTGYNPDDPSTDQGTDMEAAAKFRKNRGITDVTGAIHKIDSYVALEAGNVDEVAVAAYMFGAVGLGLQMPVSAMDQFDNAEPWSIVKGSHNDGGHYVPCVGRNSHGNFLIVTWGRLQAVTEEFMADRMDEGICYLTPEFIKSSPRGFDEEKLRDALASL